jgi:hypothetical protein
VRLTLGELYALLAAVNYALAASHSTNMSAGNLAVLKSARAKLTYKLQQKGNA